MLVSQPGLRKYLAETLCALLFFSAVWGGLLTYTGAISSGYHMMEDHEIIDNQKLIGNRPLAEVIFQETARDLRNRFTPLFNIYRISFSHFFGLHFLPWHLFLLGLLIASSAALFLFARLSGARIFISFLLPLVLIAGSQTEALLRLATNELMGLTALSFALLSILLSVLLPGQKLKWEVVAHMSTFFMCCAKENFVLVLPCLAAIKIYLHQQSEGEGFFKAALQTIMFTGIQVLILLFSIYMITCYITNNNESVYAGGSLSLSGLLDTTLYYLQESTSWYGFMNSLAPYYTLIFSGLLFITLQFKKISPHQKAGILYWCMLFIYMFTNQYLIHYKVGFSGRYLVVVSVFLGLLLLEFFKVIENHFHRAFRVVMSVLLAMLVLYKLLLSYRQMNIYTREGLAIKQTIQMVTKRADATQPILLVTDDLLHIEMIQALMKYVRVTIPSAEFDILPVSSNEVQFVQLARIYDPAIIEMNRKVFYTVYESEIRKTAQPTDYCQILVLSYCYDSFLKKQAVSWKQSIYDKHTIGESYYQFILFQRSQ